jgi:hypothetical protein
MNSHGPLPRLFHNNSVAIEQRYQVGGKEVLLTLGTTFPLPPQLPGPGAAQGPGAPAPA